MTARKMPAGYRYYNVAIRKPGTGKLYNTRCWLRENDVTKADEGRKAAQVWILLIIFNMLRWYPGAGLHDLDWKTQVTITHLPPPPADNVAHQDGTQ